jgi:hypothetical protein
MRWDDLLRDSSKNLAPIFSANMSSITLGCLWLMGVVLFFSWPYASLDQYLQEFRIPWTYFSTFGGALIMIAYVNLRAAQGEIIPDISYARLEREGIVTYEEERPYLAYEFPQALIHIFILLLLLLPFLILGAVVTGITFNHFLIGLSVLFTGSLLCRQCSFFLFQLGGRWRLTGYLGARLFYCLFLFLSGFVIPEYNPLLLLFNLHFGERVPVGPIIPSPAPYFSAVFSAIVVFVVLNQWAFSRRIGQRGPGES